MIYNMLFYICSFADLEIRAVLLDEILRGEQPDNPSSELVLDLEVKSLRDTRDLLEKVGIKDALTFIEEKCQLFLGIFVILRLLCIYLEREIFCHSFFNDNVLHTCVATISCMRHERVIHRPKMDKDAEKTTRMHLFLYAT